MNTTAFWYRPSCFNSELDLHALAVQMQSNCRALHAMNLLCVCILSLVLVRWVTYMTENYTEAFSKKCRLNLIECISALVFTFTAWWYELCQSETSLRRHWYRDAWTRHGGIQRLHLCLWADGSGKELHNDGTQWGRTTGYYSSGLSTISILT